MENAAWGYNFSPKKEILVIGHYSWVLVYGYQCLLSSLFLFISQSLQSLTAALLKLCSIQIFRFQVPTGSPMSSPSSHCINYLHQILYYLFLVPFIQALTAFLKSMQSITWSISGYSLCCLIHYFHFNGTRQFKPKEQPSNSEVFRHKARLAILFGWGRR